MSIPSGSIPRPVPPELATELAPAPATAPSASVPPVPSSSPEVRENSDANKSKAIVELKNEWVQVINARKVLIEDTKNLIEEMQQLIDEIKSHLSDNASSQFAKQIGDIGDALGEVSKTTNQQIAKFSDLLSTVQRLQINDPDNEELTKLVVKLKEGITKLANSQNITGQQLPLLPQVQWQTHAQGQQHVQGQSQGQKQDQHSQKLNLSSNIDHMVENEFELINLDDQPQNNLNKLFKNTIKINDYNFFSELLCSVKDNKLLNDTFFKNDEIKKEFSAALGFYDRSLNKTNDFKAKSDFKTTSLSHFNNFFDKFFEELFPDVGNLNELKVPDIFLKTILLIEKKYEEKISTMFKNSNDDVTDQNIKKLKDECLKMKKDVLCNFMRNYIINLFVDVYKNKNLIYTEQQIKEGLIFYFDEKYINLIENKIQNNLELFIEKITELNEDEKKKILLN